jgi:ribosome-associated toxin RatA of RatAB toxin-antitoxin module
MSTHIDRSALLLFPAPVMYGLVNDIESYPAFLDGCVGAEVLRRSEQFVEARLHLARAGIRQSFTTRNRLLPPTRIEMELVDGPFGSFAGHWLFEALRDDACKVSLHLRFQMSNALIGRAARKLFDSVADTMVDAMCRRARELQRG